MRSVILLLMAGLLSAPVFAHDYSWKHELELRAQAQQAEQDRQQTYLFRQALLENMQAQQIQPVQIQPLPVYYPPVNILGISQYVQSGFDQGAQRAQEERLRELEIQRLQQEIQQNGGQ